MNNIDLCVPDTVVEATLVGNDTNLQAGEALLGSVVENEPFGFSSQSGAVIQIVKMCGYQKCYSSLFQLVHLFSFVCLTDRLQQTIKLESLRSIVFIRFQEIRAAIIFAVCIARAMQTVTIVTIVFAKMGTVGNTARNVSWKTMLSILRCCAK